MKRINKITAPDKAAMDNARQRWNNIGKPLHSLGLLEEAVIKIAGIMGNADVFLNKRRTVVFGADNGVVCENVTQSDSSVTAIVAEAIANGTSSINRMAQTFNADVLPVDIGIAREIANKKYYAEKFLSEQKILPKAQQ